VADDVRGREVCGGTKKKKEGAKCQGKGGRNKEEARWQWRKKNKPLNLQRKIHVAVKRGKEECKKRKNRADPL